MIQSKPDSRVLMKPAEEDLNIPRRELHYIMLALNRAQNIDRAAELLGLLPRTLHQKKKKLGIYWNHASKKYEQQVKI